MAVYFFSLILHSLLLLIMRTNSESLDENFKHQNAMRGNVVNKSIISGKISENEPIVRQGKQKTHLQSHSLKLEENSLASENLIDASIGPTISFCCARHHYFDLVNKTCSESETDLPMVFHNQEGELQEDEMVFRNITRMNLCPSYFLSGSEFRVLPTGQLNLKGVTDYANDDVNTLVENTGYCLLWVENNGSYEMSALVCFPEEDEEVSLFQTIVNVYLLPISMAISALFLAATFIVYCLVKELQDLLGKSLMCSVASLCFSKIFGVIAKSFSHRMSSGSCITMAMFMHLGFLVAFFWLNVISIILFVSICFQRKLKSYCQRKGFILGCFYAFGVPLLIVGLILIHDFTSHLDSDLVPKPGFGIASCGFTNRGAQVVYFYAPVSFLLGINLILFCSSACRLFILSKQTSAFVFQFNHYLKLFVLMGIPWIFEILSFFLSENNNISAVTFVWLAFDIFNALQGVIIFFVFACRRAVFARVSETLCGSEYARRKYPDLFLQHANEETHDGYTQDLRLMDTDGRNRNRASSE